jgi:HD-GYP domain-containing protein (c-di-GMP phosphodiesterase class II)
MAIPRTDPRSAAQRLDGFLDGFPNWLKQADAWIAVLRLDPHKAEAIQALLELLLRIRNAAAAAELRPLLAFLDALAALPKALHLRELVFDPALGEVLLLALDRVKLAADGLRSERPIAPLNLDEAVVSLHLLASRGRTGGGGELRKVIDALTGDGDWKEAALQRESLADIVVDSFEAPLKEDLSFFRDLALSLERRSPYITGRTARLLRLAGEVNMQAGSPIDAYQLEAAIYMHDVGMAMLPETIWIKPDRLTDGEWAVLRTHTYYGAGLLARMPPWTAAGQMVAQHHERLDGRGYPQGLMARDICPGAKLIAIVDAFEAMTHERADRQYRKSVLRAVAEINACQDQFAREWVAALNLVVRRLLETAAAGGAPSGE